MKLYRSTTPEKMLEAFQRRIDQLNSQKVAEASTIIKASSRLYRDVEGGFGGNKGDVYSEDDLKMIWERDHEDDPVMEEYDSYEAWIADTINNGWLKEVNDIEAGCHTSSEEIDDKLEEITGQDSEFIDFDEDGEIEASFDINTIDKAKLDEVIDKYNGVSSPVSGDWETETADEQKTIADAFGISLDDAKEVMIQLLGFDKDDKFIAASTSIECHEYFDETGDAFGEPGIKYTEDELRKYFEENRYFDPVLEGYATFEDWLTDTLDNTNLRFAYVDGGCHTGVKASEDDFSEWEQLAHKEVVDTDGFVTDYTMYFNEATGQYVTVFGDNDIYRPEDGYFDAEFDNADEAWEWFDSYNTDDWAE